MINVGQSGVVIIGSDFQALGLIRCLAEMNIPIFLLEYEIGISRFSRYIKKRLLDSSITDDRLFADRLIQLAKKENLKNWLLFPNDDYILKLLSLNREEIQKWYKNPVPRWEVVQKFYYKNNAYRIAEELSIPVPKIYHSENLEDLLSQNLQFPLVLKPTYKEKYFPITKKKGVKVNTKNELINEYKKMSLIINHTDIIIQEMLLGGPNNLYSYVSFFDGKKVITGMSAQRLRQHPMDLGHATTYAESVNIPDLEDLSVKILKNIEYFGISEVEFMKDNRDGKYKFLEINGRVWGWHTLTIAAGINLPYILFQYMNGHEINIDNTFKKVKWIRLITDTPTSLIELLSGRMKLGEYLRTITGKKEYAVFSIKDPIPFFMEILLFPYLWRKRGF